MRATPFESATAASGAHLSSGSCSRRPVDVGRSSAQAMRAPARLWMMSVRPIRSAEVAPVYTSNVPVVVPCAVAVYTMFVHGSVVTVPV